MQRLGSVLRSGLIVLCIFSATLINSLEAQPPYQEYKDYYDAKAISKATSIVNRSTIPKKGKGAFLIPPQGADPLSVFLSVSEGLRPLRRYENPHLLYIPEFGSLANACLNVMTSQLTESQQRDEITIFRYEIKGFKKSKKTSYQWFLTFMDRVSMLLTPPDQRQQAPHSNSTYEMTGVLMWTLPGVEPPFYHYKQYMAVVESSEFTPLTRDVATLPAIAAQHFPIVLPYPYALDNHDICAHLPTPQSGAWLLGHPLGAPWADGIRRTQSQFEDHDHTHLLRYLESILSVNAQLVYTTRDPLSATTRTQTWEEPDGELVATFLAEQKRIINNVVEAVKRFLQMQGKGNPWDAFFPMLFLHEDLYVLRGSGSLFACDFKAKYSDQLREIFQSESYFRDLFPPDAVEHLTKFVNVEERLEASYPLLRARHREFSTRFRTWCKTHVEGDLYGDITAFHEKYSQDQTVHFLSQTLLGSVLFRRHQPHNSEGFLVHPEDFQHIEFDAKSDVVQKLINYWSENSLLDIPTTGQAMGMKFMRVIFKADQEDLKSDEAKSI